MNDEAIAIGTGTFLVIFILTVFSITFGYDVVYWSIASIVFLLIMKGTIRILKLKETSK